MENKIKKIKDASSWFYNPLNSLTNQDIEALFNNAQSGNDSQLQYIYSLIEKHSPVFQVCIKKRLSGLSSRNWEITCIKENESSKAKRQKEVISDIFSESDTRNEEGLTTAIEHLAMSSFRGRSAIKGFFKNNKLYFKKLENWNLLYKSGDLYFNPNLNGLFNIDARTNEVKYKDLIKIENPLEITYVIEDLPIDICGLTIYLREYVGEYNWARAVEKYGIAQILLKAAEGTPESQYNLLANRAMQIFEGASGVIPNGTEVTQVTDARGQDPFSLYLKHQEELISILATGGTLNTVGGSTGLGSDLATQQDDAFQVLINHDAKKISNAITNTIVRKLVKQLFPDEKLLVRFSFVDKDNITTEQYLNYASQLYNIGVPLDITKLKEVTGISFIKDDSLYVVPNKENEQSKEWSEKDKQDLKKDL